MLSVPVRGSLFSHDFGAGTDRAVREFHFPSPLEVLYFLIFVERWETENGPFAFRPR